MHRLAFFVLVLLFGTSAWADPAPLRRDNWTITIQLNPDLTYVETIEQEYTFLTQAGIPLADRDYVPFHPKSQSLELVAAYVIQPDGTRVDAPPRARVSPPSHAPPDTPGV